MLNKNVVVSREYYFPPNTDLREANIRNSGSVVSGPGLNRDQSFPPHIQSYNIYNQLYLKHTQTILDTIYNQLYLKHTQTILDPLQDGLRPGAVVCAVCVVFAQLLLVEMVIYSIQYCLGMF